MHYGGSRDECIRKFREPYMTLKNGDEIPANKKLSSLDIKILKESYAPPRKSSLTELK